MSIPPYIKSIFFLLLIFNSNSGNKISGSYNQENESIYILFDKINSKNIKTETENEIYFVILPQIDASRFIHKKTKHTMQPVSFNDFKSKLISKEAANKKFLDMMETKDLELQKITGERGYLFSNPPYDFDRYFNKIFIYEPINKDEGILYEVNWQYAIN